MPVPREKLESIQAFLDLAQKLPINIVNTKKNRATRYRLGMTLSLQ